MNYAIELSSLHQNGLIRKTNDVYKIGHEAFCYRALSHSHHGREQTERRLRSADRKARREPPDNDPLWTDLLN